MTIPLSTWLPRETHAAHMAAERCGIMGAILSGRVERPAYVRLLRGLHAIYEEMEALLARHAAHPGVRPVVFPELRRVGALAADLDALHGPGWRAEVPAPRSAEAYRDRLRAIADSEDPSPLVAHAYVRYLGDLSGGRIVRFVVARGLGMSGRSLRGAPPGTPGLSFYDFDGVGNTEEVKERFRAGLDALPPGATDAIVAEAKLAFAMHERLFEEVARAT